MGEPLSGQVGSSNEGRVLHLPPPPEPPNLCKELPTPLAAASPEEGEKIKLGLWH